MQKAATQISFQYIRAHFVCRTVSAPTRISKFALRTKKFCPPPLGRAKPLKSIDDNKPAFKSVTDFKFVQKAATPISFQCIRAHFVCRTCPPRKVSLNKNCTNWFILLIQKPSGLALQARLVSIFFINQKRN